MKATSKDYAEIASMIIEEGANVNLQTLEDGYTALMIGTINNNANGPMRCPTVIQGLLDHGADINLESNIGQTALMWAAMKGRTTIATNLLGSMEASMIDKVDHQGRTALIHAVDKGHEEQLQKLLDKGASIDAQDKQQKSALMVAADNNNGRLVTMLLERGAKIGRGWHVFKIVFLYLRVKAEGLYRSLATSNLIVAEDGAGGKADDL